MNKRCPYCGGIKFAKIDVIGKAKKQSVQTGKDYFGKVQYKEEMVFPFSLLSYFFSAICVEGDADYQAFSHMHAEVCKNCGHIEFFADENILESIHNEDDRIAAYNRAVSIAYNDVENRIKIINSIFADIEKITALSKDETITVKQQKEYLASIEEKTNEYKQAIKELDNYLKGLDSKVKKAMEPFKENIKKLTL